MCPKCGGVRCRTRETGHDAEGRTLRYRVCESCRAKFSTIEVVIPEPGSFFIINAFRKHRNRMAERQRRGYHGPGLGGPPLKPEPRIHVRINVIDRE